MRTKAFGMIPTAILVMGEVLAQTPPGEQLSAEKIMEESQLAFHYAGDDMKAKITMELIGRDGRKRTRVLTMFRRDTVEGGNQKFFIYFHEPADVRRMTFVVWKYPEKEDDRWIFVPAVDLIRRIAVDDKHSSFVGSDFAYEDVSGRDVSADTHTFVREEKLGDQASYVIQSVPKAVADYAKRLSWIDKQNHLPLKEEYYDAQDELFRVFTADKVEDVAAGEGERRRVFPMVTQRTMNNVKSGHRTEVRFTSVTFNLGLDDADFSERTMRHPPRGWTQ